MRIPTLDPFLEELRQMSLAILHLEDMEAIMEVVELKQFCSLRPLRKLMTLLSGMI